MKKIILYSNQIKQNRRLDYELLRLINKRNPTIAYVRASLDPKDKYFKEVLDYYKDLRIKDVDCYDLNEFNEVKLRHIFNYDAIHLSGGNTFTFLSLLKQNNLLDLLKGYVDEGKVLIGVSAGSIITTKSIDTAEFIDENRVGLNDRESLGLVDFDFMPHWDKVVKEKYLEELKVYSKVKNRNICACKDGYGISIDGDNIKFVGNIEVIS